MSDKKLKYCFQLLSYKSSIIRVGLFCLFLSGYQDRLKCENIYPNQLQDSTVQKSPPIKKNNKSIFRDNLSFQKISGYRYNCLNNQVDYSYPSDSILPENPASKNIFKRLYDYIFNANQPYDEKNKKFDLIFVAAPHYASDIKFAMVVAASAQYKIGSNVETPLSTISLNGDFSTTGYVRVGLNGIAIFDRDRFRLCHDFHFFSQTSDFWGVGYEMGRYAPKTSYKRVKGMAKLDFIYNVYDEIYLGPTLNFNYINGLYFSDYSYLNGEPTMNFNLNLGLLFVYDSRDFAPNAKSGIYFGFEQSIAPSAFSNSGLFQKTEVFFRHYTKVWWGGVIASEFHLASVYGDTPWSVLPCLGGNSRMRGYYEGRFRDRNVAEIQIELRQNIYKRHGMVFWLGAGNVFHDYGKFKLTHILPNFGIGYRWEFRDRINVRMDIGRSLDQTGIIFNIEEAF